MQTEAFEVPEPPNVNVTDAGLMTDVGPDGETEEVRLIVPEKPFTLVRVTVEKAQLPCWITRSDGLMLMVKSGAALVVKVAVSTVSGSGVAVPFTMVTHVVVPDTLLDEQPV